MLAAARHHPHLVAQVVPSPFGLKGHAVMKELLAAGFLGELREVQVFGLERRAGRSGGAAVLAAGRDAVRLQHADARHPARDAAALGAAAGQRPGPGPRLHRHAHRPRSGVRRPVGTPDSVQVLAVLEARRAGRLSLQRRDPFGQAMGIRLYGSEGVLHYDLAADRIRGASRPAGANRATATVGGDPDPGREGSAAGASRPTSWTPSAKGGRSS